MFYQKNLPHWERALRICLGALIAAFGFLVAPGPALSWLAYGAGAMLAVTGSIGFCPMCALAGRRLKRAP
ncbi:MAG: DUF2892 domain-containing protein [Telluria sp.]